MSGQQTEAPELPADLHETLLVARTKIDTLLMPPPGMRQIQALSELIDYVGTDEDGILSAKLGSFYDRCCQVPVAPSAKRARLADEDDDADPPTFEHLVKCNSRGTMLPALHPRTGGSRVGLCSVCGQPLDLDDLTSCWCEPTPRHNMLGHGTPRPCRKCNWAYSVTGCGCKSDGSLDSDDSDASE